MIETSKGKLPVYFGMNALARFGDMTDKTMNEVMATLANMSSLKLSEMLAFIYAGFVEGARKEEVECRVESPAEVGDMIDEDGDLITRVMTSYSKQSAPEDVEPSKDAKKK